MKKCPRCATINPETALRCDCGYDFQSEIASRTSGKAIASFILGIFFVVLQASILALVAGLITPRSSIKGIASGILGIFFWLFPIAILAVVFGHLARSQINRSGGRLKGRRMAIAGLLFGYFGVALVPAFLTVTYVRLQHNPDFHIEQSKVLSSKGDVAGAVAELREAIRLQPSSAEAHNNLGTLLVSDGDIGGGVAEYQEAIKLRPDYAEAHYNLGNAMISKGDTKSARAQYKMVVTSSTPNGLAISLPSEYPGELGKHPWRAIVLTFTDSDLIHMNQEITFIDTLGPRLEDIFKNRAERVIWLRADGPLPFTKLMRVAEITRKAGIDRINLLMKPLLESTSPPAAGVGVLGGVLSGAGPPPLPPPNAATPKRMRIESQAAAAKLIFQPKPDYPPLAKAARIQGTVKLEAVIGKDGRIRDLKAIDGHPLLIKAAFDAVGRWRYQPTLLNGEPVEVVTEIDVNFSLGEH
jgi:TonB family protein